MIHDGTHHILFIHWHVSENFDFQCFWPLRMMLPWTCNTNVCLVICFLFFGGSNPDVELLSHMASPWFLSWEESFLQQCLSLHTLKQKGSNFGTFFFANICLFPDLFYVLALTIAILLGGWQLSVVFSCISPVTGSGGYPFVCSFAICTSSLEKCLTLSI